MEDSCLYNVVLVSAIHWQESAIYICPLPLEPPSYLPTHPTLLGCQSPSLSSLRHTANSNWLSISQMVVRMFPSYCLHLSLLCPQVCFLCPCLHCGPANRFCTIIFLDSIHMCSYEILVFLFLTYITLYSRL